MQTIYLKTTDANALWTALQNANLAHQEHDPEDPLNQRPEDAAEDWQPTGATVWHVKTGYDLDVIGEIWKPTGATETNEDGLEFPIMEKLDGYHANIRMWNAEFSQDTLDLLPTIPDPTNPVRIWG